MLCKAPFSRGVLQFGCGQCFPCRVNRRRLWTHRMLLEQLKHQTSAFVTLTYDDDHLPAGGTLVPKDAQDWLKRLRRAVEPRTLRFFLVGEYGEQSWRPHYHAIIFGLCPVGDAEIVQSTWSRGFTMCAEVNQHTVQYTCGYVTKKLNGRDERSRELLNGRFPEFARMSLRPGIGAPAIKEVVDALTTDGGAILMSQSEDVPQALRHGGKLNPLGRYLRRKLREGYGIKDGKAPEAALLAWSAEMHELLKDAESRAEAQGKKVWEVLKEEKSQKILNLESKFNIRRKRESL